MLIGGILVIFVVYGAAESKWLESVCRQNGYAGGVNLAQTVYCYRIEDNRLVGIAVSVLERENGK